MRSLRFTLLSAAILSLALAAPAYGAFPGLNGRIAFERLTPTGPGQIFSIAPNGSGSTNLTNTTGVINNESPVWSADGKLIAFTRGDFTSPVGLAIWVMNANGSNPHQVTTPGTTATDAQPAFSPDGRNIVFERDLNAGGENVWVTNVNGTGQHQLVTPPAGQYDETPTWSPDGQKIAFMREPIDDSGGQIMLANADGTGAVALSHPPANFKDTDPNFSPDGTKVIFSRGQSTEIDAATNVIVVNVKTTAETPLTNDTAGSIENEDPAYSPDGKQIVYAHWVTVSGTNDYKQLYVMNADGSSKHAITPLVNRQYDGAGNWQPLIPPKPVLSGLHVTPSKASIRGRLVHGKCVKPAKKNLKQPKCRRSLKLKVSYALSEASTVAFTLTRTRPGRMVNGKCVKPTKQNKKQKPCKLRKTVTTPISGPGATGANRFTLKAKTLGFGSYVLSATPSLLGQTGATRKTKFKIVS